MPDTLDANGLQTKTLEEIRAELVTGFQSIYGPDINVDQNSPDGQLLNIFAQGGVDLREVLEQVNAGFDPDQAQGRVLDQRVAINGIVRNAGTYTITPVEITVDRALNLVGLEAQANELNPTIENLYTIRDDAGTEYYLLNDQTIASAGTYTYDFRAASIGVVETLPNTITSAVTVIAGVTGINNPSSPSSIGTNEETDSELKDRRRASVAIASIGYTDAILAALLNLEGVIVAIISENDTNLTDANGTAPHTIWTIVDGGVDEEIAAVLYAKRPAGCGMRGVTSVPITRLDGSTFTALFDRPTAQDLYIRFTITLPGGIVDSDGIKAAIVSDLIWNVGADAVGSQVTAFVQEINTNYQITAMEVSDDGATWVEVVSPTNINYRFENDTARITITVV